MDTKRLYCGGDDGVSLMHVMIALKGTRVRDHVGPTFLLMTYLAIASKMFDFCQVGRVAIMHQDGGRGKLFLGELRYNRNKDDITIYETPYSCS